MKLKGTTFGYFGQTTPSAANVQPSPGPKTATFGHFFSDFLELLVRRLVAYFSFLPGILGAPSLAAGAGVCLCV